MDLLGGWRKVEGEMSEDVRRAAVNQGSSLTNLDGVTQYAKKNGLVDPNAFNKDMLEEAIPETWDDRAGYVPAQYRLKAEFAKGRPDDQVKQSLVSYETNAGGDNTNFTSGTEYKTLAGEIKGQRYPTRMYHIYDHNGKFLRSDIESDTPVTQDIAPLVGVAATALTAGGGAGLLGSYLNTSLGLGMGATGSTALGGAAIGGGSALLTGQNPLKGAALGGIGGAVTAMNPAGALGATGPASKAINNALSSVIKGGVSGKGSTPQSVLMAAASGWR